MKDLWNGFNYPIHNDTKFASLIKNWEILDRRTWRRIQVRWWRMVKTEMSIHNDPEQIYNGWSAVQTIQCTDIAKLSLYGYSQTS